MQIDEKSGEKKMKKIRGKKKKKSGEKKMKKIRGKKKKKLGEISMQKVARFLMYFFKKFMKKCEKKIVRQ